MLVLEGLEKRYGTTRVLSGLDLEVPEGELLSVLGPSGSGKSTTLRLIAGLEAPDGGRVLIDGRDMTGVAAGSRGVAMVFQSFALFPHLTVAGNVGFGLEARRVAAAERRTRVEAAASVLGLGGLLDRRPAELSGGERQRVALARALVARPRVLLMDEPMSNLDAPLRESARAEIRRLHAETGATIVYVTHDQSEALSLGQRVAVISAGAVRQVGEPDAVYDRPADVFVARFVGSPPMNVVPAVAEAGVLRGPGAIVLPLPSERAAPGRPLLAGFRPEHVRPSADGFPARLDAVERAGHERVWRLRADDEVFAARVPADEPGDAGSTVRLAVDPSGVRLFDATSERAL
jgi:ABC-type sugar transport system ATPase subunit